MSETAIRQYLNNIGRAPLMTPAQEIRRGHQVLRRRQLLEEAELRELTPSERREVKIGERALRHFVEANMRLVVTIAKKYARVATSMDMADLMQEGAIGLQRAAELFDPQRGYKFSTYAYWWIKQAMNRAVCYNDRILRRPIHIHELASKLRKITQRLTLELERAPTKAELAAEAGVKIEEIDLLYERSTPILSLDMACGRSGEMFLAEYITDPNELTASERDELQDDELQWDQFTVAFNFLKGEEQMCIMLRYGLNGHNPHSLQEVGNKMHLSKERVRQIINVAIRKLQVKLRVCLKDEIRTAAKSGGVSMATVCQDPAVSTVPLQTVNPPVPKTLRDASLCA